MRCTNRLPSLHHIPGLSRQQDFLRLLSTRTQLSRRSHRYASWTTTPSNPAPPAPSTSYSHVYPRPKRQQRHTIFSLLAASILLPTAYYTFTRRRQDDEKQTTEILDPQKFRRFILVSKEPVSSTCSIFTLRPDYAHLGHRKKEALGGLRLNWPEGVIWSVQIKQPQLQIGRYYTTLPPLISPSPIPTLSSDAKSSSSSVLDSTLTSQPILYTQSSPDEQRGERTLQEQPNAARYREDEIRLLIRKEHQGEVSTYLHQLPIGAAIEVRGPHIEHIIDGDVKRIIFLAGGTGIAPALQAAHTLLGHQSHQDWEYASREKVSGDHQDGEYGKKGNGEIKRELCIIWANRRTEDCRGGVNYNLTTPEADPLPQDSSLRSGHLARFFPPGVHFWRESSRTLDDGTIKNLQPSSPPGEVSDRAENRVDRHFKETNAKEEGKAATVRQLESLQTQYPTQLRVYYCIDEQGSFITQELLKRCLTQFTNSKGAVDGHAGDFPPRRRHKNLILISGPEGFVTFLAGPRPPPSHFGLISSSGLAKDDNSISPAKAQQSLPIGGLLAEVFPLFQSPPTSTNPPSPSPTSVSSRSVFSREVEETWEVVRL